MNEKIEFNAQVSLLELLISNYASLKPSYSVIKKTNKKNELPWWLSGEESTCQCRRHGFDPWSRKISHAVRHLSLSATTTEPVLLSLAAAATKAYMP